jgi:predicted O-methyltransferase YrrM
MPTISGMLRGARETISRRADSKIDLTWVKKGGWLGTHMGGSKILVPGFPQEAAVDRRAAETSSLGELAAHESYGRIGLKRNSDDVRTPKELGRFYRWLAVNRRPEVIVEFGTAFGISGMYWLAGIESNKAGKLVTFEINEDWRKIAVTNLSAIGTRFTSVAGAFEDHVDDALQGQKIDLAFIDAIHTSAWVLPQFEHVMQRMKPGGLVAFDDIDFSDDMRDTWKTLAADSRGVAAVGLDGHVGLIELK